MIENKIHYLHLLSASINSEVKLVSLELFRLYQIQINVICQKRKIKESRRSCH